MVPQVPSVPSPSKGGDERTRPGTRPGRDRDESTLTRDESRDESGRDLGTRPPKYGRLWDESTLTRGNVGTRLLGSPSLHPEPPFRLSLPGLDRDEITRIEVDRPVTVTTPLERAGRLLEGPGPGRSPLSSRVFGVRGFDSVPGQYRPSERPSDTGLSESPKRTGGPGSWWSWGPLVGSPYGILRHNHGLRRLDSSIRRRPPIERHRLGAWSRWRPRGRP